MSLSSLFQRSSTTVATPSFRVSRLSLPVSLILAATLAACGGGGDVDPATPEASAMDATSTQQPDAVVAESQTNEPGSNSESIAAAQATDGSAAPADDSESSGHRERAMSASVSMVPAGGTPPGPGTANLQWAPPMTKANGTAVGSLTGYRIYYGTASGKYAGSVFVSGSTASGGAVAGLTSGKWYFTVAAVDTGGNESTLGYELSKTL